MEPAQQENKIPEIIVLLAGATTMVYVIWQSRNKVYWEQCVPTIHVSCQQVEQIVKARVKVVLPHKVSRQDNNWFHSL